MEVHFTPDLEAKLTHSAAQNGRDPDELAQEIIAQNLPFVFLGTPNILAGADARVGNFHPVVIDPYTLWNADELYVRDPAQENAGVR